MSTRSRTFAFFA